MSGNIAWPSNHMDPVPASYEAADLLSPAAYPHDAAPVTAIETPISRVYLAGDLAYKTKKPVRFEFVDFSRLESRHADCEREVLLNRRFGGDLYLEVVPVCMGTDGRARFGAPGAVVDYAVKMRRFPQTALLGQMAIAGTLKAVHIDRLAVGLAAFHAKAPIASAADPWGSAATIRAITERCLAGIDALAPQALFQTACAALRARMAVLAPMLEARRRAGHVREGHGDLHLGNVVLLDGRPTPFDCLAFDPALRWIDTMSDLAFAFMDLIRLERRALAYRLLNAYLEASSDHAGLTVFSFYVAQRALIRARVALEIAHGASDAGARGSAARDARHLAALALATLRAGRGDIVAMHGYSGSGKSTVAGELAQAGNMVRVRSDAVRAGLYGKGTAGAGRYTHVATERTYRRLRAVCRIGVLAGVSMIADATYLRRTERDRLRRLARRLGVRFAIVHCEAPQPVLERRIVQRAHEGMDPSEADAGVLAWQRRIEDRLGADEHADVIADNDVLSWVRDSGHS